MDIGTKFKETCPFLGFFCLFVFLQWQGREGGSRIVHRRFLELIWKVEPVRFLGTLQVGYEESGSDGWVLGLGLWSSASYHAETVEGR